MRRLALLLPLVLAAAACGGANAQPSPPLRVSDTYLGLDCHDNFPCPHLGIAVWLAKPAAAVRATVHGHVVVLRQPSRDRRVWVGFVRDKVAERMAEVDDMSRTLQLTVAAVGPDGAVRRTTVTSPVSPGWG